MEDVIKVAKAIFKAHGMFPLDAFESLSNYEQSRYIEMAQAAIKEMQDEN